MKDSQDKIKEIEQFLITAKDSIHRAQQILIEMAKNQTSLSSEKIQGVFDGEKIVSLEGKEFGISEQFAATSKLVKGDVLEIISDGNYKVMSNVPRKELIGEVRDQGDYFVALADGKNFKILNAAVHTFGLAGGDKVALVVPSEGNSDWAAIEGKINESFSESTSEQPVENDSNTGSELQTHENAIPETSNEVPEVVPAEVPDTETGSLPKDQNELAESTESIDSARDAVANSYEQDLASDVLDRPSNNTAEPEVPTQDVQGSGVKELDI